MLLEREDSFMSEFEDACSAWMDSVGSSGSDGTESDVGSPFCQGEFVNNCAVLIIGRSSECAMLRSFVLIAAAAEML